MNVCWCILGSNPENCKHCNNNPNKDRIDWGSMRDKQYNYTYTTTALPKNDELIDEKFECMSLLLECYGEIGLLKKELEKAINKGYIPSKLYKEYVKKQKKVE